MTSGRLAQPLGRLRDFGDGRRHQSSDQDEVFGLFVRHPILLDLAVAVTVATLAGLSDAFGPDYRSRGVVAWDVLLAVPLVLRRWRPASAAALIAGICLVEWVLDVRAVGDVAFLVALYSLGAYERRRWVIVGAVVVAEVGVVLAVTRYAAPSQQLIGAITATGTVTASWVVGIYMSMRRSYVASMRERAETAERDRDSRAQVAVAAERARLAREMHDVIAHSLSVMITLNDAAAAVELSGQARETITQASDVGRQALGEMHRMLAVLRDGEDTDYAPQPGLADLPDLLSVVRAAGLTVELAVTGDLVRVSPTAQLALYRIVQEGLTNVLKHARNVKCVKVELNRVRESVTLRVDDDGSEVDVAVVASAGHGLSGMGERARLFGGEIWAGPADGGGWSVRARLALTDLSVQP